jgi:hypothetical protein
MDRNFEAKLRAWIKLADAGREVTIGTPPAATRRARR